MESDSKCEFSTSKGKSEIMAIIEELNHEVFDPWVASRPLVVQTLIQKLPPNLLYRLKSTGHRVYILSYAEDGTVTVAITADFNRVDFERQVFGIFPEDLEECDFPAPDEPLGALLTGDNEIKAYIADVAKKIGH